MTRARKIVAAATAEPAGGVSAPAPHIAGLDSRAALPAFMDRILARVTAGRAYECLMIDGDGTARLAFTLRRQDDSFRIRDAADRPAGTFASFDAAISAGLALAERI